MKKLTSKTIQKFQAKIFEFYAKNGRHSLPWRKTKDPYKVLVSEIMLQQTQVDRVIPKYEAFLKQFPDAQMLAGSNLKDVLVLWKGLGYNNRAIRLRDAARVVVEKYKGKFPKSPELLDELPGIGPYTARAIAAFSFNTAAPLIETNIRRIFIHEFFPAQESVSDSEVLFLVEQTLPAGRAREWYWALMDYGTYLSKQVPNPNRKSKHYSKQSKFEGSLRQGRAKVVHAVAEQESLTHQKVKKLLEKYSREDQERITASLIRDKVIIQKGKRLFLGQ